MGEIKYDLELSIDFTVYCHECGEEMDVESVDTYEPYYIRVEPCDTCLKESAGKGEG